MRRTRLIVDIPFQTTRVFVTKNRRYRVGTHRVEILAAAPLPSAAVAARNRTRRRGLLVAFPPPRIDPGGAALAAHSAYVRLCRWAGDGYQPVYSSLVCGSERSGWASPRFSLGEGKTGEEKRGGGGPDERALVARVPTMHVPIGCLRGGGGSTREPGCMLTLTKTKTKTEATSFRGNTIPPVSRRGAPGSGRAPRGWPRRARGRRRAHAARARRRGRARAPATAPPRFGATTDARDFADFDVSSPADGDARAVVLVERWAVRAGTRARPTDWGPSTRRGGTLVPGSRAPRDAFRFRRRKKNATAFLGKKALGKNVQTREGRKGTNDDDDDDDDGERREKLAKSSAKEETKTNSRVSAREARVSWTPSDSDWSASDASESDERETRGYAPGRTPRGQLRSSETKGYLHIARRARFDASPETKPPVRSHQTETDVPSTEAKNAFSSSPARSDARVIMTPTRALLERASLARRVGNRADDAVAVAEAGNASTSRALGLAAATVGRRTNRKRRKTEDRLRSASARRPVADKFARTRGWSPPRTTPCAWPWRTGCRARRAASSSSRRCAHGGAAQEAHRRAAVPRAAVAPRGASGAGRARAAHREQRGGEAEKRAGLV